MELQNEISGMDADVGLTPRLPIISRPKTARLGPVHLLATTAAMLTVCKCLGDPVLLK